MGNIIQVNTRWVNGEVPFIIDEGSLNNNPANPNLQVRLGIEDAINEWNSPEKKLKVRLVPRRNEAAYLIFNLNTFNTSGGSNIGMGSFMQMIWATPGSRQTTKSLMLHEIGHALGLYHEQNRKDRDAFVTIDYSNIQAIPFTPYFRNQFDITVGGHDFSGYDFDSIMHYDKFEYAVDTTKPTIMAKDPSIDVRQKDKLSVGDIAAIRFVYGERIDRAQGNPVMIQSNKGAIGNFELIVPLNSGKFLIAWRDNSDRFLAWHKSLEMSFPLTGNLLVTGDVFCSMIQGNIGGGNFELIAQRGQQLFAYYASDTHVWNAGATPIKINGSAINNAFGNPSLIQNRDNNNLEVIVADTAGGIMHCYRDTQWREGGHFGKFPAGSILPVFYSEVSLIQSSYTNFEVIARAGSKLYVFYRNSANNTWSAGEEVKINGNAINNAAGGPVLIQNRSQPNGNFEMVVPVQSGGIDHFYRHKDTFLWHRSGNFAANKGVFDQVTFIQSSFSGGQGFEVIGRKGQKLYHYFRDANHNWKASEEISLV